MNFQPGDASSSPREAQLAPPHVVADNYPHLMHTQISSISFGIAEHLEFQEKKAKISSGMATKMVQNSSSHSKQIR